MDDADPCIVLRYLAELQDAVCSELEREEPSQRFRGASRHLPTGGVSRPRVLTGGRVFEKAAVMFTHARGARLPDAASERRRELIARPFEAVSVSAVVHPRNPHAPSVHMNLRAFFVFMPAGKVVWWFGGGYDLTPYYPYVEDVLHWHKTGRAACDPFGRDIYPRFKNSCDEYFYLPHRNEMRGVGGLFFDDLCEFGFETTFALVRRLGDHFLLGYMPILRRRKEAPYSRRERRFQLYRRGRYVEFNLLCDRGTRYGLQSGRRIESVLASLPPVVKWVYDWHPAPGTREAELCAEFLRPRDWLGEFAEPDPPDLGSDCSVPLDGARAMALTTSGGPESC